MLSVTKKMLIYLVGELENVFFFLLYKKKWDWHKI